MKFYFEPYIALRYLRSKRKEVFISIITVISVLGVAVSVVVLNMALAIMTGFESELQSKLINANEHIVIRKFGGTIDNWSEVVDQVSQVPGVHAVFPFTYNQVMLSLQGTARGIILRGIADHPAARQKLAQILSPGASIDALFSPAEIQVTRASGETDQVKLPAMIVGRALERQMALDVGTPVTLLSPELSSSPQGLIPKLRRFVVVGSYSSGLNEYESVLSYISLKSAQDFFSLGNTVSGIEVEVDDLKQAPMIGDQIRAMFEKAGLAFSVVDWTEANRPLWKALELEKKVYFLVLLLLIFVASFSIVSTLVMVVMEKSRDIAVMKTIGATDSSVLWIFFIEGTIIGGLGTVLGTGLGYLGCLGLRAFGFPLDEKVFGMSQVPVYIIPSNFLVVAIAAFIISCSAGIYPAWRAARLKPADALRFE